MSQNFWKVYKAKVLQTFNTEEEEGETREENDTAEIMEGENLDNGEEGLNVSHFARKVQGAFGWSSVTSLFTKEEQRADQKVEQIPEQAVEHSPSSHPPDNPLKKSPSALWDVFSSRWHQNSVERSEARGVLSEPPAEQNEVQQAEETSFRWSFLTTKLADLRSKTN